MGLSRRFEQRRLKFLVLGLSFVLALLAWPASQAPGLSMHDDEVCVLVAIVLFGLVAIVALLVGGIRGIFNMRDQLGKLNGSVGKIQTWRVEHEKLEGSHHEVTKANITELWAHVNKLKEK